MFLFNLSFYLNYVQNVLYYTTSKLVLNLKVNEVITKLFYLVPFFKIIAVAKVKILIFSFDVT